MEKKTHLLVLREIKGLAETSGFLAHFPLLPLSGGKQLFLRQKGDQRHGQGRQTEVDCCADIESHYFYPARAQSARARRACRLRALGLLLADSALTVHNVYFV